MTVREMLVNLLGTEIDRPCVVQIRDLFGNPVMSDVIVELAVEERGGSVMIVAQASPASDDQLDDFRRKYEQGG